MHQLNRLLVVLGLSLVTLAAEAKVTVFAAASMTNALEEVTEQYKKVNPNEEVVLSFASSSVLARQITEGAPADVFVSADQKWMNFLADKQAIVPETRSNLVGNKLVMIAPKESKIKSVDLTNDKWQKLLEGSFLAVGDPDHVPAGIYAKTAFTYLKQWDAVEKKLARADNVRKALLLVEKAESPLGVVYATDAAAGKNVKVVATFPAESHLPIEYPVAIVKGHDNPETKAFFDYLKSDSAKAVYEKFGFTAK
ncbi:molybdate transport system substrate-binding protein [Pasteurella langaaensis DSM 22999]|uniref:Molybdate transport system substrate-binding protein n=1 Tax=Alitibacter langaaensis DSM 22999 TaxID=1122935 RepID=A0A2U0SMZ5_9PAST|nr:molybdate ABC transporter substrate-binding protein [Pasteurella langaaensis]PVX32711.1 molybdate transport system substrate-binding protein [Pasteurella langaaensis DSM 22999]